MTLTPVRPSGVTGDGDALSVTTAPAPRRSATPSVATYHTIGIGAGPANLSFAALFEKAGAPHQMGLFDRQPGPQWHPSLLFSGVRMQTSWLKDLVTLVDPQHRLSFLSYAVSSGRIFGLINAQYDTIPRGEYMRYLAWAAERLPNIHWSTPVDRVSFDEDAGFTVHAGGRPAGQSDHLVLGVGTVPYVPPTFASVPPDRAIVPDDLWQHVDAMTAHRSEPVGVVGGGQTGAECALRLLRAGFTDIRWFGRRPWFQSIDDTPPANDFYRPAYQSFLQELSRPARRELVSGQVLTGDAITPGLMRTLYQANYDAQLELGRFPLRMLPGRDVVSGELRDDVVVLEVAGTERTEWHDVRYAVLATGRRTAPMPLDEALADRLETDEDGSLLIEPDYQVRWKGGNGHKLFALNRARLTHGIPDANLTLLPVRSALAINSLLEREVYAVHDELVSITWG
ncbi:MAG: SidA/IucD/PvdA family monooxygenase [Frankiaceae bacterium]